MILNTKYKTNLCRNYEMNGSCHMGAKCHFAHGKEELRNIHDPLPPNTPYIADPKAKKINQNGKGGKGGYGKGEERGNGDFSNLTVEHFQALLMKDSMVQNQVTLHQLSYIIQNLENLHAKNGYILTKLNVAKELLCVSNLNTVAELIQGILQLKVDPEVKLKHDNVVKQAQELSNMIYYKLAKEAYENAKNGGKEEKTEKPLNRNHHLVNRGHDNQVGRVRGI